MISAGPTVTKTIKEARSMAIHIICISDNVIITRHKNMEDLRKQSMRIVMVALMLLRINCSEFLTIALRTFLFVYLYTA